MEKKQYTMPQTEVAQMNLRTTILTGSPTGDWSMGSGPAHPGVPGRRWSDVF